MSQRKLQSRKVFPVCVLAQHQALLILKDLDGYFLTEGEKAELERIKSTLRKQTQA